MHIMTSLLTLLLAALHLAAATPISSPFRIGELPISIKTYMTNVAIASNVLKRIAPLCNDLTNITMDFGTLPPPSEGLKLWHIAVGRGTQNYSCPMEKGEDAAPTPLGAVAKLYNATCAEGYYGAEPINGFTDTIALQPRDSHMGLKLIQSGNHYFPDLAAKNPIFNLNTGNPNTNYGIALVNKKADAPVPADAGKAIDGSTAVPWLKLAAPEALPPTYVIRNEDSRPGIKEIYRLNTAGGAAPKACAGILGQSFTKEYAAEYWFWH